METVQIIVTIFYIIFAAIAILLPIFRMKPFTYFFSKKQYPAPITKGEQFAKINNIMSYIWGAIFLLAILLQSLTYHKDKISDAILSGIVPIFLFLAAGLPLTKHLPSQLIQKIGGTPIKFKSIQDMFLCMPYGLNKEKASNIDAVIQFYLIGKESTTGYLSIKDGNCSYYNGEFEYPTTTIKSDSELWLKISNNEVDGDSEYLNKSYLVEGDSSIIIKLHEMFSPPKKSKREKFDIMDYKYKTLSRYDTFEGKNSEMQIS